MLSISSELLKEIYHSHYYVVVLIVLGISFGLTYYLIPKIIWVVKAKRLMQPVNQRSAHKVATSSFGGVAFFVTFILVMSGLQVVSNKPVGANLVAAMTILFVVGLKDDLVNSSARVKLIGQILAVAFIVFFPKLEIHRMHGFLWMDDISVYIGYIWAAFVIIALINAYNLIDGINGLAGIVGTVIALTYAILFYSLNEHFYTLIAIAVAGVLVAFLRFNFAEVNKRIFMGDSGTLIIGLILGFLTLRLLSLPEKFFSEELQAFSHYRWLVVMAIFFIPIFDTAQVMIRRWRLRKSMFSADRNHTHHILLDKGCSHASAGLILGLINSGVICLGLGLIVLCNGISWLIYSAFALFYLVFYGIVTKLRK